MLDRTRFPTFPVLETERLVLRELQAEDAEALFAILSNRDNARFYDVPFTQLEQAQRAIERHRMRFYYNEAIRWGITLRGAEETLIGNCGYNWDKYNKVSIVSYVLAQPYWGRGIMTEALRAIVHFGFAECDIHRMEADVAVPNIGSIRVLLKLGFREEGYRRERLIADGKFYDERMFGLLKGDILPHFL